MLHTVPYENDYEVISEHFKLTYEGLLSAGRARSELQEFRVIPKSADLEIRKVPPKLRTQSSSGYRHGQQNPILMTNAERDGSRVGVCWDTRSRPSRTNKTLGSALRKIRTGSWRSASRKGSPVHKSNRAFVPLSTGNSPSRLPIAGFGLPTESPKAHGRDTRL